MPTLNDAPFKIIRQVFTTVQNNSIKDILGSDTVSVEHMGYSTEPLRLVCFVQNEDEYDNFKEEYHSSGTQTLIIHENSGRQYTVYGLGSTTEIDGEVENYKQGIVFLATFKQATPYKESTEEITRTKSITTQNQEWSVDDPYINLLENDDFEEWSDGASAAPDGWILSGGTIAREGTIIKTGTYSAKLMSAGSAMALKQELSNYKEYKGVTITLGAWVWCDTAAKATIQILDGVSAASSANHTGGSSWEWLSVSYTIDSNATKVEARVGRVDSTSITAYFDDAVLVEGSFIPSSGKNIATDGNVDAVPDIQVTAGNTDTSIIQSSNDSNYNMSNSGSAVTISQTQKTGTSGYTFQASNAYGQTVNCRKAGMAVIDYIQISIFDVTVGGNVTCTVYDSVSGTALGSKVVNVTSTGVKTFTFANPIAVVQDENTCADSTDTKKIYFKFVVTGSTLMALDHETPTPPYADGKSYDNDSPIAGGELYFVVGGHSCKEIRQTFEVDNKCQLSKVLLNLCKYQYAGTNPVTVVIKEGGTTLGTGTSVLSGTTFADVTFELEPNNGGDLILLPSTTYTLSITPPSDSDNTTDILIKTNTSSVYADGEVTLVEDGDTTRVQTHDIFMTLSAYGGNEDVQIYNTADTTVKCNVSNYLMLTTIHRINVDGTGTIDFDDDFTTDKWKYAAYDWEGITHDEVDDELDIADDGYIYWNEDTKYPITGTPTQTARINITAGTPTIQISTDAVTWYDIDTAIVDDVETVYPLDSDGNLSLAGKTVFYWRIDCVKAAAATCSVKSFELDIAIHTIYAKNPKITKGAAASTFRCDQDPDSGLACEVALIFRHRWWT